MPVIKKYRGRTADRTRSKERKERFMVNNRSSIHYTKNGISQIIKNRKKPEEEL